MDINRACKSTNQQLYWRMFEGTGPWDFYGVDNTAFKLDVAVFGVIEDEDDGYRSYFDCLQLAKSDDLVFFDQPIAEVMVHTEDNGNAFTGWILEDSDGHEWLRFGTDWADDYYPCFVFNYNPKKEQR